MHTLTAKELADRTGGKLLGGSPRARVSAVSINTRTLQPGDLFFALKGRRHDAHDFLDQAMAAGAAGAVVAVDRSKQKSLSGWPLVLVDDTLAALGRLAAWNREQGEATVVGITGSAGKTTTKELIAHLLAPSFPGVKAPESFNNAIGVPLSLLQLEASDRFAVIEIGSNAFGEVGHLAAIAKPDIGLVTGVGDAHLEQFGSRWGVAWEKGHLVAALPYMGVAILNGDDHWCRRIAALAKCRAVTFGFSNGADVRIESFRNTPDGIHFTIDRQEFDLAVPGRHNALNAAAAVAAARELGLSLEVMAQRARTFRLPPMRMERLQCGSITVVADEYNASPTSVSAALSEYRRWRTRGRKLLVLGDMLELGARARELHASVGESAAQAQIDGLWVIGPLAQHAARGALRRGMDAGSVRACLNTHEACQLVPDWLLPHDTLLLKGSRGMSLEQLLVAIERRYGARSSPRGHSQRQELFESYRAAIPSHRPPAEEAQ